MDAELQQEFSKFPDDVKKRLVEAISHQSAEALGRKPEAPFSDYIAGLPDYAFEWLIRFETDLIGAKP